MWLFFPFCPSLSPIVCPTSLRRASLSWPSRDTSWGPTQPSSPRTTQTPARMQPGPPTHLLAEKTWRARVEEEANPTLMEPLMALEATNVKTTDLSEIQIYFGSDEVAQKSKFKIIFVLFLSHWVKLTLLYCYWINFMHYCGFFWPSIKLLSLQSTNDIKK